ncbi:hypothetical protein GGR52DRAFT_529048 [Hypoxylon sp. FL1284]|nr:hypothetical protein GGR52DRAFT_529048 [Hypoxylon sp. FL1284]
MMERNAWSYREYSCSVCGLGLRSPDCSTGALLEDRGAPLPGFDTEDAIAKLAKGEAWLDDIRLLCDPDDEVMQLIPSFSYQNLSHTTGKQRILTHPSLPPPLQPFAISPIQEFKGEHMGGPCFYLYDHDGTKREVNVDHWDFPTFDGRPYIPVHSACLDMAKRMMKSSSHKYLSSVRGLFLALRWRHAMSNMFGAACAEANYTLGSTCWYLPREYFWESGEYYEDESGESKAQWPGPTNDAEFNLLYTFLGDPVEIENMTDEILSNLKPCRRQIGEAKANNLGSQLAALPDDIYHIILSHFRSFRDLPREAVYALPQHFWKNELMLAGGGLLPWLWDIDPNKVESKANEPCPGGDDFEWNWELLVRQLSCMVDGGIRPDVPEDTESSDHLREQFKCVEDLWGFNGYGTVLELVPRGLDNRRRIWQLLEEMFVGDQLPLAGELLWDNTLCLPRQDCVQLPWTKEGALKESAIWLPSINTHNGGAFLRRIGGQVYRKPKRCPMQYWQTAEFRRNGGEGCDEPVKPASVPEILEVIRKLGYPA